MVIHEQIKVFISKKCDGSHNSLMKEFSLIELEGDTFPLPPFPPGREHCVILLAGFPWGTTLHWHICHGEGTLGESSSLNSHYIHEVHRDALFPSPLKEGYPQSLDE